jgi:dinuclear metal center YbgI/SA1388 family protein
MKTSDVYCFLDSFAPFSTQLDFDNAGFQCGDRNAEFKTVVVALDCTEKVVDFAIENGAELIVTHHPLIFKPLKSVMKDSLVLRLIKNGITLISAHTNLDMAKGGVCDLLCEKLGLSNVKGFDKTESSVFAGKIGVLKSEQSPEEFAKLVGSALETTVRAVLGSKNIKTVGVCSGSGGDLFEEAIRIGADAFVTGDVKHSLFIEAENNGITLIDGGHFATENIIVKPLCDLLKKQFPDAKILPFEQNPLKFI